MEDTLLYPAYPIMHVMLGDGYVEYLLSAVLATHGYTIRDIRPEAGTMVITCRSDRTSQQFIVVSFSSVSSKHPFVLHWNDLRIRYTNTDGRLSSPRWTQAIAFGKSEASSFGLAIMDSEFNTYSLI